MNGLADNGHVCIGGWSTKRVNDDFIHRHAREIMSQQDTGHIC